MAGSRRVAPGGMLLLLVALACTAAAGAGADAASKKAPRTDFQPSAIVPITRDTLTPSQSLSAIAASHAAGPAAPLLGPETRPKEEEEEGDAPGGEGEGTDQPPALPSTRAAAAKIIGKLAFSVKGINALDSRLADSGNAVAVEPPDQGLCVGNGFIVEAVNQALRVYKACTGGAVIDVVSLNSFYQQRVAINRTDATSGPLIGDPSCVYDPDVKRFFVTNYVIDVEPTSGNGTGTFGILTAVSKTSDPRGAWWIYRLPTQNNGIQQTPVHSDRPAFGDYPHIGTDADGFYITTNEFTFGAKAPYAGANVYAVSKRALAAGVKVAAATNWFFPAATFPYPINVIPAKLPAASMTHGCGDKSNTAYFVSTQLVSDDGNFSRTTENLQLWSLHNTGALSSCGAPATNLVLRVHVLPMGKTFGSAYRAVPQKKGINPLGITGFDNVTKPNSPVPLVGAFDSRVMNVMYADGKLWGAFMAQGMQRGKLTTGAVAFIIDPEKAKLEALRVVAHPGMHYMFPSVAVNHKGQGIMGFSLTSTNNFPSIAYVLLDKHGVGPVVVVAPGLAPFDGLTGYTDRPRFGDYGAGAADEAGCVYHAGEYIPAPACSPEVFLNATGPGRCGNTRAGLVNWGTRITKLCFKK